MTANAVLRKNLRRLFGIPFIECRKNSDRRLLIQILVLVLLGVICRKGRRIVENGM